MIESYTLFGGCIFLVDYYITPAPALIQCTNERRFIFIFPTKAAVLNNIQARATTQYTEWQQQK